MDLHSGNPYWPQINPPPPQYPALERDESCEVAVIGGGITGALVAWLLTDVGVDTVLVDKGPIAAGSTAASTALLQYELDTHLVELEERVGRPAAVRAYELGLEAIGFIRDLIGRIGDPCGFAPRPSLYFASNERDGAALQAEFRAREAAGLEVELLGPGQVGRTFPFSAPAAIYSQGDAEIDAYRFSALLVQAARERGLRVRERTAIVRKEDEGGRSRLFTDEGRVLTARQIVFATGYESERFLRQKTGRLCTTYAFVSHPLENLADWPERCLLWETARPYLYARTSPDGRALVGGEDHPWAGAHRDEASARRRVGRLAQRFGGMFPDLKIEVSAWWAGVFAESKDGLAYIGPSPEYANAYFALGYGGNGITYGAIAALVLADLCRGRPNRDADLFRFDR